MTEVGDMVFDGVKYGIVTDKYPAYISGFHYDIAFTDPETNTSEVTCFYSGNYVDTWRMNFLMGYHQKR
jgi:hypothetical protein